MLSKRDLGAASKHPFPCHPLSCRGPSRGVDAMPGTSSCRLYLCISPVALYPDLSSCARTEREGGNKGTLTGKDARHVYIFSFTRHLWRESPSCIFSASARKRFPSTALPVVYLFRSEARRREDAPGNADAFLRHPNGSRVGKESRTRKRLTSYSQFFLLLLLL